MENDYIRAGRSTVLRAIQQSVVVDGGLGSDAGTVTSYEPTCDAGRMRRDGGGVRR